MIICNQAVKPSQNLFDIDKNNPAFLSVNRRMKDWIKLII